MPKLGVYGKHGESKDENKLEEGVITFSHISVVTSHVITDERMNENWYVHVQGAALIRMLANMMEQVVFRRAINVSVTHHQKSKVCGHLVSVCMMCVTVSRSGNSAQIFYFYSDEFYISKVTTQVKSISSVSRVNVTCLPEGGAVYLLCHGQDQ